MYLSKLILNPRSRAVHRDLSDCRGLHRTILAAFPTAREESGAARLEFGLLYRAESDPRTGRVQLIVQSEHQPDWSVLPPDYLATDTSDFYSVDNPALKRIDHSFRSLALGQRLRFRLRANPTRRVSTNCRTETGGGYGKRVEIHQPVKQLEWLQRKGTMHGFNLVSLQRHPAAPNLIASPEARQIGWRGPAQPPMKFGAVTFEGVLEIADIEKFTEALAKGIGSGKAYGFGLLSIAPAPLDTAHEE